MSVIASENTVLDLPREEESTSTNYSNVIKGWLKDIMYGAEEHEWGVIVGDASS